MACAANDEPGARGGAGRSGAGSSGLAGGTGGSGRGGHGGASSGARPGLAGEGGLGPGGSGAVGSSDVEPLDALLSAEYVVIAAYTAAAGVMQVAASDDARFASKDVLLELVLDLRAHHQLHAQAVLDAIHALDGAPTRVSAAIASYRMPSALDGNRTIDNALKYLASLEKTAAVRYSELLSDLDDPSLRFLAASIAGTEAQHFVVLAALALGLLEPGPSLGTGHAGDVVPKAFVATVGAEGGLDTGPGDYFPG